MYFRFAACIGIFGLVLLTQNFFDSATAQPEIATVPASETLKPAELARNGDHYDFLIAGGDGYGATECLANAGPCGDIVANAWCDSKGFSRSVNYRVAGKEEVTASTGRVGNDQAFIITCTAPK